MKNGSALITIVLVLTVLVLAATNVLRSSIFAHDIALERQRYEQRYQLVSGLMNYALQLCKENFDTLLEKAQQKPYVIELANWPDGNNTCSGTVTIENQNGVLAIHVTKKGTKKDLVLACTMQKKQDLLFVDNFIII